MTRHHRHLARLARLARRVAVDFSPPRDDLSAVRICLPCEPTGKVHRYVNLSIETMGGRDAFFFVTDTVGDECSFLGREAFAAERLQQYLSGEEIS